MSRKKPLKSRRLTDKEQTLVLGRRVLDEHPTVIAATLNLPECLEHIKELCVEFDGLCED